MKKDYFWMVGLPDEIQLTDEELKLLNKINQKIDSRKSGGKLTIEQFFLFKGLLEDAKQPTLLQELADLEDNEIDYYLKCLKKMFYYRTPNISNTIINYDNIIGFLIIFFINKKTNNYNLITQKEDVLFGCFQQINSIRSSLFDTLVLKNNSIRKHILTEPFFEKFDYENKEFNPPKMEQFIEDDRKYIQIALYQKISLDRKTKGEGLFTKNQLIYFVRLLCNEENKKLDISKENLFELLAPYCYVEPKQSNKVREEPKLSYKFDRPALKRIFEQAIKDYNSIRKTKKD